MGPIILDIVWSAALIAAAFVAGRASHDPPAAADPTVIGSLGHLVDEGLLSQEDCADLWRQYVAQVRGL